MSRITLAQRLAGVLCCAAVFGLTSETHADFYAYAVQQTSGYSITGSTIGDLTPLSTTSAAQVGSPTGGDVHTGGFDAVQAYVGPAAGKPAENTFTPLGQTNASYVRGDALVTTGAAFGTNNVAEAYLTGAGNSAGSGSWAVSSLITLTASGTVTLSFSYTNQLTIVNTGSPYPGTVAADYGYTFTIQNANGTTAFTISPDALNKNLSLGSTGSITSGTPTSTMISLTSTTLAAGTYTATISGSEHTFINAAVPEPSSIISAALGLTLLGGAGLRNRFRRSGK